MAVVQIVPVQLVVADILAADIVHTIVVAAAADTAAVVVECTDCWLVAAVNARSSLCADAVEVVVLDTVLLDHNNTQQLDRQT